MGRGFTQYGSGREAEVDNPAGARIRKQDHGTYTCKLRLEYVIQPSFHTLYRNVLTWTPVFETELVGIKGVSKDEL